MKSLSVAEVSFLLRGLPVDPATRGAVEQVRVNLADRLTPEQIDTLRDMCGERLQQIGFDEQHSATPAGLMLATLVDKLYLG